MARMMRMVLLAAVVVTSAGCVFFAARSDFYVDNRSSAGLTVAWTRVDGTKGDVTVDAGTRVMLMSERLIETDMVLPSNVLASLTVSAGAAVVHAQNPIDDGLWERTAGSGSKDYVFDLVITDANLP